MFVSLTFLKKLFEKNRTLKRKNVKQKKNFFQKSYQITQVLGLGVGLGIYQIHKPNT